MKNYVQNMLLTYCLEAYRKKKKPDFEIECAA